MENKFKDILKELRMEKGISQDKLSKDLKLSKGIISMWENGLREPGMTSLIILADYFGVSIDFLVGRADY